MRQWISRPDYESISAAAAKLAATFDDDYWSAHDERKEFPWEFYNAFAAAGWVGVVIPEKYGGAGLGVLHAGALLRAVDRPIGQNQAIAHPLADSYSELIAAELLWQKAAWVYDRGEPAGPLANMAKFRCADASFRACDRALQTFGGFGYAREYHVERYWREARLMRLAPISQEMALNFVAEHVLQLPRSY